MGQPVPGNRQAIMASSHRWKSLGAPPRKTSPRGRTSSHTTETMPGGGPLRPTPLLSRRVTYHKMPNPRPQHRSPIPYSAVHMARSRWASTEYPVMRLHHPGCSKAREQQRVVCQVGGASPARQRLAGSREILGACDRPCRASSDQIHTLGEFDRSLVTWPSATSLTSRRTSSWHCRVQICLPGVAQAAFDTASRSAAVAVTGQPDRHAQLGAVARRRLPQLATMATSVAS
jgi:hypothetical protein